MLIQIDKLVQLLESPVFTCKPKVKEKVHGIMESPTNWTLFDTKTDLRLQLLEPERYPYLFKCLYGILMLLPQSSAFSTLRNRLNSVSSLGFLNLIPKT